MAGTVSFKAPNISAMNDYAFSDFCVSNHAKNNENWEMRIKKIVVCKTARRAHSQKLSPW